MNESLSSRFWKKVIDREEYTTEDLEELDTEEYDFTDKDDLKVHIESEFKEIFELLLMDERKWY